MRSFRWSAAQRRVINAMQYADRGLTVSELAGASGVNPNTIRNYLTIWRSTKLVLVDDSSVPLTVRLNDQFLNLPMQDLTNHGLTDDSQPSGGILLDEESTVSAPDRVSIESLVSELRLLLVERTEPLHTTKHSECEIENCRYCEHNNAQMLNSIFVALNQASRWARVETEFTHVSRAWDRWVKEGKPAGRMGVIDTLLAPCFLD